MPVLYGALHQQQDGQPQALRGVISAAPRRAEQAVKAWAGPSPSSPWRPAGALRGAGGGPVHQRGAVVQQRPLCLPILPPLQQPYVAHAAAAAAPAPPCMVVGAGIRPCVPPATKLQLQVMPVPSGLPPIRIAKPKSAGSRPQAHPPADQARAKSQGADTALPKVHIINDRPSRNAWAPAAPAGPQGLPLEVQGQQVRPQHALTDKFGPNPHWDNFFSDCASHSESPLGSEAAWALIMNISPRFEIRRPEGYIPITPSSLADLSVYQRSPFSMYGGSPPFSPLGSPSKLRSPAGSYANSPVPSAKPSPPSSIHRGARYRSRDSDNSLPSLPEHAEVSGYPHYLPALPSLPDILEGLESNHSDKLPHYPYQQLPPHLLRSQYKEFLRRQEQQKEGAGSASASASTSPEQGAHAPQHARASASHRRLSNSPLEDASSSPKEDQGAQAAELGAPLAPVHELTQSGAWMVSSTDSTGNLHGEHAWPEGSSVSIPSRSTLYRPPNWHGQRPGTLKLEHNFKPSSSWASSTSGSCQGSSNPEAHSVPRATRSLYREPPTPSSSQKAVAVASPESPPAGLSMLLISTPGRSRGSRRTHRLPAGCGAAAVAAVAAAAAAAAAELDAGAGPRDQVGTPRKAGKGSSPATGRTKTPAPPPGLPLSTSNLALLRHQYYQPRAPRQPALISSRSPCTPAGPVQPTRFFLQAQAARSAPVKGASAPSSLGPYLRSLMGSDSPTQPLQSLRQAQPTDADSLSNVTSTSMEKTGYWGPLLSAGACAGTDLAWDDQEDQQEGAASDAWKAQRNGSGGSSLLAAAAAQDNIPEKAEGPPACRTFRFDSLDWLRPLHATTPELLKGGGLQQKASHEGWDEDEVSERQNKLRKKWQVRSGAGWASGPHAAADPPASSAGVSDSWGSGVEAWAHEFAHAVCSNTEEGVVSLGAGDYAEPQIWGQAGAALLTEGLLAAGRFSSEGPLERSNSFKEGGNTLQLTRRSLTECFMQLNPLDDDTEQQVRSSILDDVPFGAEESRCRPHWDAAQPVECQLPHSPMRCSTKASKELTAHRARIISSALTLGKQTLESGSRLD